MAAKETISKAWKGFRSLPMWQQVVIVVVVLIVLYIAFKKIKAFISKAAVFRNINKRANDKIEVYHSGFTWGGVEFEPWIEYLSLTEVAYNIWDSFYNNDWLGLTEDESEAVKQVLRVPKEYIPELAKAYAADHNENLYEDFQRFLGDDYYNETVLEHLS